MLLLAVLSAAACEDDPSGPRDDGSLSRVASAHVVDTAGPLVRSLSVELDGPSGVEVFYEPIDGGRVLRMRSEQRVRSHDVLMPRLRADTTYRYVVRTWTATETSDSVLSGTFTTGPLPPEIAGLQFNVQGDATFPVVMISMRTTATGWVGQLGIDTDGYVTWYHTVSQTALAATRIPDSPDVLFIENGLTVDTEPDGLTRVAPDGQVVQRLDRAGTAVGKIHHDVTARDAERILFIANETQAVGDTMVTGEAIWEWNMRTGALTQRWSAFDFLDWNTDRIGTPNPTNWLHANSISVGPRGNVVVSFRSLNQVISIAPDYQSLEWRIGGPNATHAIANDDRFIGQHSAWELDGGRLLVFDNRGAGPDGADLARALELEIGADSVEFAWEYAPGIQAFLRGSVYRLDNGNSVVTFPAFSFVIDEVDADGQLVWRLSGDNSFTPAYRGVPWPSIAGEEEVAAMP